MEIDHRKLSALAKELDDVLRKRKPATLASQEVKDYMMLLTYYFATQVLDHEKPKEALLEIPPLFRDDVKAFARAIHKWRTPPTSH